jgi:uncharacterized damage-inducible protein DinB
MNEIERIKKLFEDLYEGDPWIDINLLGRLQKLTAAKASRKLTPDTNSIWEIVNHLIQWRENVLLRLQGTVIPTPSHNYFTQVKITTSAAWKKTLDRLDASQLSWLNYLDKLKPASLNNIYPGNNMTYYEHIQGILQHDTYHLGQIVLLMKATQ